MTSTNQPIFIRVSALSKKFKNVNAVNNISFDIAKGDIFAFLGPNGAGKTTTLRILLDIIKADGGSISWQLNAKSTNLPPSSNIGYLPEERGLYTDLPVLRSLVYLASIRGMDPKKAKEAAHEWLEKLELADRAKEKLQALSKGNQQKIQFIASVLHQPDFAILDEPFSGLDPLNQEKFIEYIKELNNKGTTILLSSHQMPLVEKLANKVFLINNGNELYNGSLENIYNDFQQQILELSFKDGVPREKLDALKESDSIIEEGSNFVKVSFKKDENLNNILKSISELDGISDIKSHNSNLHEIFLNLVKKHTS